MQARDLMSTPVITTRLDATVGDAADIMLSQQISCLPALDDNRRLVGILTHTDFGLHHKFLPMVNNLYSLLGTWTSVKTLEESVLKVQNRKVKDVMKHPVVTIQEDAMISDMTEVMLRKGVNRLPVMREETLIGIITRHDLLKLVAPAKWRPAVSD